MPTRRAPVVVESLCLLGIFALTFEVTCRVEDWVRYRTPLLSPFLSQADLIVVDVEGIHGRPAARFQKWVMNSVGMRGPETTLEKPSTTIRIAAVGASETFGLYESSRREFPRQLEDSLNARIEGVTCPGTAPPRFEVLNAALPGMSLPTVEQDLRRRVSRFAPDVVLLYPTPAQYLDDEPPRPARGAAAPPPAASRRLYPRAVDRMRSQAKAVLPNVVKTWLRQRETAAYVRNKPAGWRFASLPSDRLARYEHDLRSFIGTVRSMRAVPVIATHANAFMQPGFRDPDLLAAWEKFYPRAPGEIIVAFDSVARQVTLEVAADSSATVVDLARDLPRASERTGEAIFSDFSHFTDLGAAQAAAALRAGVLAGTAASASCGFARTAE